MTKREIAIKLMKNLPNEKVDALLTLLLDENTLARIEADALIRDKNSPRFFSVEELIEDLQN